MKKLFKVMAILALIDFTDMCAKAQILGIVEKYPDAFESLDESKNIRIKAINKMKDVTVLGTEMIADWLS